MSSNLLANREAVSAQLAAVQNEVNTLSKNNSLVSCLSAASAMYMLDQVLTDDVVHTYFFPLMNTRAGFLTDRNPNKVRRGQQPATPYTIAEVRACLKDAILKGLLPVGNQFNIISGSVYITREGYTALLSRMGVKHRIIPSQLADRDGYAVYSCRIEAMTAQGDRISYTNEVLFKRGQYDSDALLQGKAYARSVKSLWTYVSGLDSGDAVEDDAVERVIEDAPAEVVPPTQPGQQAATQTRSAQVAAPQTPPVGRKVATPVATPTQTPSPAPAGASNPTNNACPF